MSRTDAEVGAVGIDPRIVCFRYFSIAKEGPKASQDYELFARRRLYYARTSQYRDQHEFAFELEPSSLRDWLLRRHNIAVAAPQGAPLADRDQAPELKAALRAVLANGVRVCCFTHDPCSRFMWTEYAANFTGYVVGFKVASFSAANVTTPRAIQYLDDVPALDAVTAFDQHDDFERVIFRKATTYAPEQEFRSLIYTPEAHDGWVQLPDDVLAFSIFGENMNPQVRQDLDAMIRETHPAMPVGLTAAQEGIERVRLVRLR